VIVHGTILQGCYPIMETREFRKKHGISCSIRQNQGEKKDILKNQGKSGKL